MSDITGKKVEFVSQEVDIVFQVASGVSAGTMFHDMLNNRDLDDQHPISSITGLLDTLAGKQNSGELNNVDNTSDLDKPISSETQSALDSKINVSDFNNVDNTSDVSKPVSVYTQDALDLKVDISDLNNVDNTSDIDKPISIAQQAALDTKIDIGSFNQVDNTSDLNKPVSISTQSALDLKADKVDLDRVDNTTDLEKPISTATQNALDGKISVASLDNVDNTSDLNKPVSTAQQAALDLKVDVAAYMSFYANTVVENFTVTSVEPAYEEIGRLAMVELDTGTYEVQLSGRVQCDTVGRKAFIRWSLDGGATWEDPVAYNVLDVTDKKPFTHIEVAAMSGSRTVIVQAAKASGVGSMIINKLDIVCERKI